MDRLTIEYCGEYVPRDMCSIDRLGGADDCDLCCEYCKATEEGNEDCRGCAICQCFNKLGEYETLEEQGRLLKLPVVVGDMVYYIAPKRRAYEKLEVKFFTVFSKDEVYMRCDSVKSPHMSYGEIDVDEIGKTVFLTKEAAEAALKEMSE